MADHGGRIFDNPNIVFTSNKVGIKIDDGVSAQDAKATLPVDSYIQRGFVLYIIYRRTRCCLMSDPDEFFIGWQGKAPEKTGKFIRSRSLALVITGVAIALVLALLQQTIGRAWFEFGNVRTFNGILVESPVPMLLTESPDEQSGESVRDPPA